MATPTVLGERFVAAVTMANDLHRDQRRKGTPTPYVAHLLGVCSLVLEAGGDEDAAVAALLHDAVEDQGGVATLERIAARFGPTVAAIVLGCSDTTETPKPPALERKRRHLEHLDRDDTAEAVLLVAAADKVHNLRSLLTDERTLGPGLWERFNLGPADQLRYFRSLADVLRRRLGGVLSAELDLLVEQLAEVVGPDR